MSAVARTGVLSLALVAIGIALLLAPTLLGLAQVVLPERFWYKLFPDGTSDEPTYVTPGDEVELYCELVFYDAKLGVRLPSAYNWLVSVRISAAGYSEEIVLETKPTDTAVRDGRYATRIWRGRWVVPEGAGVVYKLDWLAVVRDKDGNELARDTRTTYAATSETADGYFLINGREAQEETLFVVFDPTLTVEFVATLNPEAIERVYVDVYKGGAKIDTFDLAKEDGARWSASYTLPGPGTYVLSGYFVVEGEAYQKMSVVAQLGEERLGTFLPLPTLAQIAGIGLVAAGGVLFAACRFLGKCLLR